MTPNERRKDELSAVLCCVHNVCAPRAIFSQPLVGYSRLLVDLELSYSFVQVLDVRTLSQVATMGTHPECHPDPTAHPQI